MNIALVAHDKKKAEMIEFAKKWQPFLINHSIYSTNTTGNKIMENTDLDVTCLKSGPMGGDQEVGSMIANGKIDLLIFFRDPLTSQPHEPDVSALIRLCDVYTLATATNKRSADLIMESFTRE